MMNLIMNEKKQQIVSIIGRPNVGKSTLFNRLIGKRQAIESSEAGTTRDRLYGQVVWCGKTFTLVDTAGFLGEIEKSLSENVKEGIMQALGDCSQILFVVDAKEGLVDLDYELSRILRKSDKEVILVINKADGKFDQIDENKFKRLGFENIISISSISGQGSGDLLDKVCQNLTDDSGEIIEEDSISVSIIGKPNVGKSTLFNTLIGKERMLVSDLSGTTRDSQDYLISHKGENINLIDTAGMRRKGKIKKDTVESFATLRALSAMSQSNIVIYLADAGEEFSSLDANLVLEAKNQGKSIVIAINKIDNYEGGKKEKMAEAVSKLQDKLNYMPYLPVVFISAKEKENINSLLNQILKIYKERHLICDQKIVDKILEESKKRHSQIAYVRELKFEKPNPPVFKVKTNKNKKLHFSDARYLENKIRDTYPFIGTPLFIDQLKN